MASRYVLKFSKDGYAKYTSHLDLLRFFKRAFRKSGLELRYSQGFNPHPKLGFAQPLSLGYSSDCELLEFETVSPSDPAKIKELLAKDMPLGLEILDCLEFNSDIKSLAGACEKAEYQVTVPAVMSQEDLDKLIAKYLAQPSITAMKRQKKDKKIVEVQIKHMIRSLAGKAQEDAIILSMCLDCGSTSNCSPELVIASFCKLAELDVPRFDMEVHRVSLGFYNNLQF